MKTMQPALRNGRNVWDQVNMPASEFKGRVDAVRDSMRAQGINLLFAYGNGFNEYAHPCYFSNYIIRLPRGALVAITMEGEVTLFFEGAPRGLPSAKAATWVEDVRPCKDVAQATAGYLEEKGMSSGRVGFAGLEGLMPYYQLKSLKRALKDFTVIDVESMILDMRMVKSSREQDQIRRASRIVRKTFDFISGEKLSDMKERSLEAMLFREARLERAEDVRILIGRPLEDGWALRPCEDGNLVPGTVIIYLALAFERYWSEGIRTFKVKENSLGTFFPEHSKALYEKLLSPFKPGKGLSQCYEEAVAVIQEGDVDYISDYGLGEGIGLSLNERPFLDQEQTGSLEQGTCLSLRLCTKDKAIGALMIGDTFCVTGDGVENLTA